jgi:hypothetical protein
MGRGRPGSLLLTLLASASLHASEPLTPLNADLAARENGFYRMVTIPTPPETQLEAGALVFTGPDKLAVASRWGEIWIGEGVLADPPTPKWTLYERGLHEVLGLAYKDDALFATQRGEVTRLPDANHDNRSDAAETVNASWGITGDYHEYAFGSKFDRDGNLWVVTCLTGSGSSKTYYRGWALRITPEGKAIPTCSGIRSPGGIGMNAAGDMFYTDNQGPWNGACKLQWLKPGVFVGHIAGLNSFDNPMSKDAIAAAGLKRPAEQKSGGRLYDEAKRIPELLPPAVYFPYPKMGQSTTGIANDGTGGKFGPFQSQLFLGDQTHSTVMRVFLEKTADGSNYQGACFPFRQGFASGNLALEFAPDGSLFVQGTSRGWGTRGGQPYALERLVWTGKTPFEIHEMRAKPDGFELTFTEPVDPKTAADPASYAIETYIYLFRAEYGSPEVDQTKPTIQRAVVAADGRSVRLIIEGLVEGHVHELHVPGLKSATGQPLLHDAAYYTLNQIPKS